jgi:hypothetical protein
VKQCGTTFPNKQLLRVILRQAGANTCPDVCRDKAEAHTAGVSKELAEREECLGNLLEAARAEAAAATAAHETDLAELRQSLELRMATVRADVADWQVC